MFAGASISETFYGLTRYNLKNSKFQRRDFIVSFAFLVILPYLLRKMEKHAKAVKEKLEDELRSDDKYKLAGVYTYRTLKSSYEFAQIIKYISYLSGRSSTHNIPLFLSGIGLRHANPQEDSFSFNDVISGNVGISTVLGSVILRTLEFGGFFLQFMQWYQDSSASQKIIAQLPTPEAPKFDSEAKKYSNVCPLCFQQFVDHVPTVLTISGYVFCYKCITKHLRRHQYCPVTNYPATIDDLTRLYDN
jgi:peroxin-12